MIYNIVYITNIHAYVLSVIKRHSEQYNTLFIAYNYIILYVLQEYTI